MKRWILLAGLVVVLTSAATMVAEYLPEESPRRGGVDLPVPPPAKSGPQPRAEVEGDPTYHFGKAAQHITLKKNWVIKNTGQADLEITIGPPACSCTIAKFAGDKSSTSVKPNESATIHLSFETRDNNGRYHKAATIATNDDQHQVIELAADGEVHPAVVVYPDSTVNFLEISNDEPDHPTKVAVFSPDQPDMKITKIETSRPGVVIASQQPMTEEDCAQLKIKKGYRLDLNVKSGMPLGSFREEVVLSTDHPKQPEVRVTLLGRVVGPITVTPARMLVHDVLSRQGAERELKIVIRGRRATKFQVVSKPEMLKVEVVPSANVENSGIYNLVITIPPGTAPGTLEDQIVLKTDHPLAGEVKIPVNIFIRDAG